MEKSVIRSKLRSVRIVLSFALLGAIAAGAILGWTGFDMHPAGLAIGAIAGYRFLPHFSNIA